MRNTTYDNTFITYDDDATWLVTYADLMTLLLVFFVLLYTLGSIEMDGYKTALKEINIQVDQSKKLAKVEKLMSSLDPREFTIEEITGLRSRNTELLDSVNQFVANTGKKGNIVTRIKNSKIIIDISGQSLFPSGSADLSPEALPIFDKMILIFEDYPEYLINIKGHTDNRPIATRQFPSNWELSAIRATNVLKYLISRDIDPYRLTATGYGDIMPRVPNTSDKNRSINRRVEFVLEKRTPED